MKRGKIYKQIVNALKFHKLNIQQISTKTGIRWETVKNAVDALTEAGFLKKDGRAYNLEKDFSFDEDTILGIPVPEEKKKQLAGIANRFRQLTNYNNTFLQKAVINVIKRENLDLPYGWYLFGECSAVMFNKMNNKYTATKKYEKTIKETISEFSKFKNTDALMENIYEGNQLYMLRLQIDQVFKDKLTKHNMRSIELAVKQMLFVLKGPSYYFLDSFYSQVAMLKKLDEEQLNEIKLEIYAAFRIIWEIIGTQKYKETVNLENIDFYYKTRMEALEELAHCYLLTLKDYWPRIEFSEHIKKMRKKYSK